MAQRKELLKAHAFTQQRLVAALVDRDPDNPTPPLRRLGIGTFVSILVATVLVGGFALFGYLTKPSTNAWSQDKPVVIVDTDVARTCPSGADEGNHQPWRGRSSASAQITGWVGI